MAYLEAIKYLESFINYEKILSWPYRESLKLERIKGFLAKIGNPQGSLRCIHTAGSKGKGSTCAFIAHILRQAGFKVGLYTSPHLSDFRERIRIFNRRVPCVMGRASKDFEGMISKSELTDLVGRLKPALEEYNQFSTYGPLSFFEVYTVLAFKYFKEQKVDFAVLETGLGGRLDATNVVSPLICAITPISYEHTQKLGNTLREIANEKAGIIKRQKAGGRRQKLIVISAPQEKEAQGVIRNRCKVAGVKLYEVNRDIFYEKARHGFNIRGIHGEHSNCEIRLLGRHQFINAAVAVGVAEALESHGIFIDTNSIREGLYNTLWPGRCEVISRNPVVILDGAQNIASAGALRETIKENFQYKRLILVLGVSQDKDTKGICEQFYNLADEVILTMANNPRATSPGVLAKYFDGKVVHITRDVKKAKEISKRIARKNDLVLVTGSLFIVGEFRDDHKRYQ